MPSFAQAATEHLARMGEIVSSANAADVLTCIGLGSCIGLALLDRRVGVAGLAHVMLPECGTTAGAPAGKFADTAVPALVAEIEALGAVRHRLDAVIVGGAAMFSFGSGAGQEIGRRNEDGVKAQLDSLRIPLRASMTGGTRGRTIRVEVGSGRVSVREAAGEEVELVAGDGLIPLRRAA